MADARESKAEWFQTTHWTVILNARAPGSVEGDAALEELCRNYWRPVYAFIRRETRSRVEAQDLTQQFFAKLIEKDLLQHLVDRRGKFRSFLLTLVRHFLSDERDRQLAQKRGGGRSFISLDDFVAEEQRQDQMNPGITAEQAFDRSWAENLMSRAFEELASEYERSGQSALFNLLKAAQPALVGGPTYAELGSTLGLSESAIKSAMHRLRQRHRKILCNEITRTVGSSDEVQEEIRYFIEILGR